MRSLEDATVGGLGLELGSWWLVLTPFSSAAASSSSTATHCSTCTTRVWAREFGECLRQIPCGGCGMGGEDIRHGVPSPCAACGDELRCSIWLTILWPLHHTQHPTRWWCGNWVGIIMSHCAGALVRFHSNHGKSQLGLHLWLLESTKLHVTLSKSGCQVYSPPKLDLNDVFCGRDDVQYITAYITDRINCSISTEIRKPSQFSLLVNEMTLITTVQGP